MPPETRKFFERMGITEILGRIWLFSANKTKSSEYFSKQPTQLIVKLNSSLWHIIITYNLVFSHQLIQLKEQTTIVNRLIVMSRRVLLLTVRRKRKF